jgi:negative regulator of replication initiation
VNRGTPVRTLRVDDELWHHLEDRAVVHGLSSSEYLRRLIARDAGVPARPMPTRGVPRGVNVRQLIRDVDRYMEQRITRRAAVAEKRRWR